eukprot:TRINITY_DN2826_c0_g1_i4.p1 TRINITY_DN2826_c0_g1~~TRINITY_DN2826_c0_g1_i4.p1  ORF type:complete len:419 (+),score=69.45 TRINITY_DN2826_c0_g1_i4:170-1426(+)
MWQFCAAILFLRLSPDSLLLVSIYGLTQTFSVFASGSYVGHWTDGVHRLRGARLTLIIQNASVGVTAFFFLILLEHDISKSMEWCLIVGIFVLGMTSDVSSMARSIIIGNDWVVTVANNDKALLTDLNSMMRRIDLVCKLAAPLASGFIMAYTSSSVSCIYILSWNVLSAIPEYWLLKSLFLATPSLQKEKIKSTDTESSELPSGLMQSTVYGFRTFYNQSCFLAFTSLAVLYFTVLSFGYVMTGYVYWTGMSEDYIASSRGVAALMGVMGTYTYPYMSRRLGLQKTALVSIWFQLSMLLLPLSSPLLKDETLAVNMLMIGVIISRVGLWTFDLAITQIVQESVAVKVQGVVNGTHRSLANLLDMMAYVLSIALPDPNQFDILILISFCSVFIAAVLYTTYYARNTGIPQQVEMSSSI